MIIDLLIVGLAVQVVENKLTEALLLQGSLARLTKLLIPLSASTGSHAKGGVDSHITKLQFSPVVLPS